MYETGTTIAVRAYHVMPGMPAPEGERHPHDYRLEVVAGRESLDDRGMVVDLDALGGALARLAELLGGADLDRVVATGGEPVTVERFARWLHGRLADDGALAGTERLSVRVWESAEAFGGFLGPPRPAGRGRAAG